MVQRPKDNEIWYELIAIYDVFDPSCKQWFENVYHTSCRSQERAESFIYENNDTRRWKEWGKNYVFKEAYIRRVEYSTIKVVW